MIFYLPLERMDKRYTTFLDDLIVQHLNKNFKNEYLRIYPNLSGSSEPENGMFLNAGYTMQFKSEQISYLCELYRNNIVNSNDIVFTSDVWFPGLAETITYLNYFYKKNVKLQGLIHAGSFTDTDFVRDMERWAKYMEDIIFDRYDKIFVASEFIKNDILKKRICDRNKLIVAKLPLDYEGLILAKERNKSIKKENIIIFNGRNVDEKQPYLFDLLAEKFKSKYTFINTMKNNYSKDEYYDLLCKSKIVVSFALQENFGYAINESVFLGNLPVLPNRLVYPEFFDNNFLYNTFDDCCNKVEYFIENYEKIIVPEVSLNLDSLCKYFNKDNNVK